MRWFAPALACLGLALAMPAHAQSNNGSDTPLGSRIKTSRQFREDLYNPFGDAQWTAVNRKRTDAMMSKFGKCLFNRNQAGALDLLQRTDFGFASFKQIGLDEGRAAKIYGFDNCAENVARASNSGVQLGFSARSLRQMLVQEAYFDRFPDGPAWLKPGDVIGQRTYPLSKKDGGVLAAMDFADCIVADNPYASDFFYRTASGSDDEKKGIADLTPSLAPCLPAGETINITAYSLRVWLGEALWFAANNSGPALVAPDAAAETPKAGQ
jgi:hypothetical protein